MSNYSLSTSALRKNFGRRLIFENLNFSFNTAGVYGISGPNGSGKSTLVKMIAGLLSPTSGEINHKANDRTIIPEELHKYIGFASPYLILYEEFSAQENLNLVANIRKINPDWKFIDELLSHFLLIDRKNDLVKSYSSGMKQRLKFVFALLHNPRLLILDEPTSNLDDAGKEIVYKLIEEISNNSIVIVASNEKSDLEICREIILLEKFKPKII
ncbi:MAG: heme ABC exporter ATP-binding protein CcmA [Ignavibacteriaceae bacterium]